MTGGSTQVVLERYGLGRRFASLGNLHRSTTRATITTAIQKNRPYQPAMVASIWQEPSGLRAKPNQSCR